MYQEIRFLDLLDNALDQPTRNREAFVRASSSDPALTEEVLRGLAEMDDLGDFLERPAAVAVTQAGSI